MLLNYYPKINIEKKIELFVEWFKNTVNKR